MCQKKKKMDSFCTNYTNNVTDREHLLSFQGFEILILANQWMRKRQWQSTPVLLPGTSHGRRSLVGYSPWGREESDMTRDFTFTFHFHALEKEMTTHSSVLAWRIPGMVQPGVLPSMGSHRVRHN